MSVRRVLGLGVLVSCVWATPARADLVTLAFTGTITGTWEYLGVWFPGLNVGDPFFGTAQTSLQGLEPNGTLVVNVGGYQFTGSGFTTPTHFYSTGGTVNVPTPLLYPSYIYELFWPSSSVNAGLIQWTALSFDPRYPNTGNRGWTGAITSVSRVAEPSTIALLVCGLLSLAAVRARLIRSRFAVSTRPSST